LFKSGCRLWKHSISYEKGITGNKQIYVANYYVYSPSAWLINKISNGGNNINPRYGPTSWYDAPSYQSYSNGVWKVISQLLANDTSSNLNYNCENAVCFSYPIITKRAGSFIPFFIVYDSDSLSSENREIIYRPTYYWEGDTAINLSNSAGDDYKPFISFYRTDTTYLAIFWTHEENGKKDIWMAKSVFTYYIGAVNDPGTGINNFSLGQNYPNPFSSKKQIRLRRKSINNNKLYNPSKELCNAESL